MLKKLNWIHAGVLSKAKCSFVNFFAEKNILKLKSSQGSQASENILTKLFYNYINILKFTFLAVFSSKTRWTLTAVSFVSVPHQACSIVKTGVTEATILIERKMLKFNWTCEEFVVSIFSFVRRLGGSISTMIIIIVFSLKFHFLPLCLYMSIQVFSLDPLGVVSDLNHLVHR